LIHYPGGKSAYSLIIPESVTSIEFEAFHDCGFFLSIIVLNPVPFEIPQMFPKVNTVYVPSNAVSAYKEADGWKKFKIVNIDDCPINLMFEFLDWYSIVTDNTKYTYYDAVKNQNVTVSVIDQYELEYILSTGNFSGAFPLHFDIEDGRYTYDKIVSVESNSVYKFSLYLNIGYNLTGVLGTDIWTTTYYIAGKPSRTELNYRYHSCNVIASKGNEVLSTKELNMRGSRIPNISISDLTFVGNATCGTNPNSIKKIVTTDKAKIYPNPTSDIVYIGVESDIKVYNSQGILLQSTFGNQVDLSVYAQGLYLLQINGEMVKVVKK